MTLQPLLTTSPAIQLHLLGVAIALVATALIFTHPRGRGRHRLYGWIWVLGMGLAAVSSLFIHSINGAGRFSPIHLIAVYTMFSIVSGLYAIRIRRSVKGHRSAMLGMTFGGLGIAGALSFLPGRLMPDMLF